MSEEIDNLKARIQGLSDDLGRLRAEFEEFKRQIAFRPKSAKAMTLDDARRVTLGDLSNLTIKEAALNLGLSYGQVYSAKNGYTFKEVYEEKLRRDRATQDAEAIRIMEQEKKEIKAGAPLAKKGGKK